MLVGMLGKQHVHIFEYERKDDLFTGLIVCTVCGVYLSSSDEPSAQEKAATRTESQRDVSPLRQGCPGGEQGSRRTSAPDEP